MSVFNRHVCNNCSYTLTCHRGHHGRGRMEVGFTTTCEISVDM